MPAPSTKPNGRQRRWATLLKRLRHDARKREAELLLGALQAADWSVTYAARNLGLRLSTLQRMLSRHPHLARLQAARAPGLGHDEEGHFVLGPCQAASCLGARQCIRSPRNTQAA